MIDCKYISIVYGLKNVVGVYGSDSFLSLTLRMSSVRIERSIRIAHIQEL